MCTKSKSWSRSCKLPPLCERMLAESGKHGHQSGDRAGEQIDDGLVPRVTKEIIEESKAGSHVLFALESLVGTG